MNGSKKITEYFGFGNPKKTTEKVHSVFIKGFVNILMTGFPEQNLKVAIESIEAIRQNYSKSNNHENRNRQIPISHYDMMRYNCIMVYLKQLLEMDWAPKRLRLL
jgi:hypothetical protein